MKNKIIQVAFGSQLYTTSKYCKHNGDALAKNIMRHVCYYASDILMKTSLVHVLR
jgi:hypothetical protein